MPQIDDPQTADEIYAAADMSGLAVHVETIESEAEVASSGITIDWSGTLTSYLSNMPVRSDEWIGEVLCRPTRELSLAEQTGLVVRIGG